MSELSELIDNVKRLSKTFRPLLDLEQALDGVKDMDKALSSLNARLAQAQNATTTADSLLKASQDRLAASLEAEKAQRAALAEAADIAAETASDAVALAKEEAQSIRDQAKRDAIQVLNAAHADADRIREAIPLQQGVLDGLVDQTLAQQVALADVKEQIAAVKRMVAGVAS